MNRIVITGSTRGIGRAVSERFLEAGWSVVINGRSSESVSLALEELRKSHPGSDCVGIAGDCASEPDMKALWDLAASESPVDVWINNAGVDQSRGMFWELDNQEIESLIRTNVVGSFVGTSVAIQGMSTQKAGTVYLMEGFGSNGMVQPGLAVYGTSKAAITYMGKALRRDLKAAESHVRVGTISPGMVMTDLLKAGTPIDPKDAREYYKILDILADTPETVSAFISGKIIDKRPEKITWLTGSKAGWRFATAFARKGRFSREMK